LKIGIPRALLYYWYGHQWTYFWQNCGWETLVSAPTDRAILRSGAARAVDELCLPVKIFIGHVLALQPVVERIMVPHLIQVEPDAYICPKFMGLPDLIAHTVPEAAAQVITVQVGSKRTDQWRALVAAAGAAGVKRRRIPQTPPSEWGPSPALQEVTAAGRCAVGKRQPELTLGLLGHPYCLYDACFNLDLLRSLARNRVRFLTPEHLPPEYQGCASDQLEKELFWTVGRKQLDALQWMLRQTTNPLKGIILVTPFACGPEALVGDLLERRIRRAGLPLLKLNYEEHSGEAGVITRLEAFLDLIKFRSKVC
jgi:predicted nucleotide-binding protein (sugar kinase/HSP70/actin superfamily)